MTALKVFLLWSGFGWLLLAAGLAARRGQLRRQERERTRATGTVVERVRQGVRRGSVRCRPVIAFMAEEKAYRLECKTGVDETAYPVGRTVEVLYDPDDPTHFHLDVEEDMPAGRGARRAGLIWIACAAVLTLMMNNLAGGYGFDFSRYFRRLDLPRIKVFSDGGKKTSGGFEYELSGDATAKIDAYNGSDANISLPIIVDGHIVTGIATGAFTGNRTIQRVTVPGTISAVPAGAFAGCLALTDVELSEGVTSIGRQAFAMCASLKRVTVPESVTSVADDAFGDDCAAVFRVVEGSAGAQYCEKMGFAADVLPRQTDGQ